MTETSTWRQWLQRLQRPSPSQTTDGPQATAEAAPRPPAAPPIIPGPPRRGRRRGHPVFNDDALYRAWRTVRANGGGPGVDGVDIARFEAELGPNLARLRDELNRGTYRPNRVNRVLIPKKNEGLRPLAIWALRDRVAQRAVMEWLEPQFEPRFLACSHGFRPGRSVDTAVAAVAKSRDGGLMWVADADIKECFDSIDAALLIKMLREHVKDRKVLVALEHWLQAGILNADGRIRAAGAAQGGVLSPLLCNIYLHSFDEAMTRRQLALVRYADDFVILCRRQQDAEAALEAARKSLAALKLELHPQKTRVVSFDQGFKFLGYFFIRKEQYKL
ncbi:MAG: group II intron reverse transcriptase/maturase [Anaerolineae bacterium]